MTPPPVRLWRSGGVRVVTLARPERANALDRELAEALDHAVGAPPTVSERCCLITGEGRNFCAGADHDILQKRDGEAKDLVRGIEALFRTIEAQPLPVLAWLNGPAIGAGAILAALADIRLASPAARLSLPAGEYAITLASWSVDRLASQLGQSTAKYLILGGGAFSSERLLELGVAQRSAANLDEALAYASVISAFDPKSMVAHRRMLQAASNRDLAQPRETVRASAAGPDEGQQDRRG